MIFFITSKTLFSNNKRHGDIDTDTHRDTYRVTETHRANRDTETHRAHRAQTERTMKDIDERTMKEKERHSPERNERE